MSNAEQSSLAGVAIMVAEDEAIIGMLAENVIRELGGRFAGLARTCEEALTMLAAAAPQMILLDVHLKGGTSERVVDAAAALGIPVVVSSGSDSAALPAKFHGLPTLRKPWSIDEMSAVFATVLAKDARS